MKIKWLAHAAFLITAGDGTRIITDPYETSEGLRYGQINEAADIVTVSHEHGDHNNTKAVKGSPQVVRGDAEVKGIKIRAIATAHDDKSGGERGQNTVFCFEIDGIGVCHAGDLGHVLSDKQVAAIGAVDVLMVPVGGFFTIDASAATRVCEQLKPKVIIPMHFKTEKLAFPIQDAEGFLKGKANVTRAAGSEIELTRDTLPASPQIMVLKPAL
jgi:L-ascorbate metabolism protein UlaG (beta-lactamase superfamily)